MEVMRRLEKLPLKVLRSASRRVTGRSNVYAGSAIRFRTVQLC